MQYAGGPIYTLALLGFKIALLASYLRIGGFVTLYKVIIYVVIAAVTCNQLIFTFVITLACHPVCQSRPFVIDLSILTLSRSLSSGMLPSTVGA